MAGCRCVGANVALGRFDPFAALSGNDRYLRIGAVHCVVFARQQSPSSQRRKHAIGFDCRRQIAKPELKNRPR
jgi:hypothetical protein